MGLSFLIYKTGEAVGDGQGLCHLGQSMEWPWPGALAAQPPWAHHYEWGHQLQGFLGNLISNILSHVLLKCNKMPNVSAYKLQLQDSWSHLEVIQKSPV